MREYSTPLDADLPESGNLTDDVVSAAAEMPDRVMFSRRTSNGWADVTAAEFLTEVTNVAKGLMAAGIEPGDRVALLSKTRYEWTLLDYAIWFAGAVSVPIYETSSTAQISHILGDSGTRGIVAETREHAKKVSEARSELPELHHVWTLDDNAIDVLVTLGEDISDEQLEERRTSATLADVATLIYTSGTTGRPRGCIITHHNLQFELTVAVGMLNDLFDTEEASTLLFLPLAHVFARIIEVGCVKARVRMGHSSDISTLLDDFAAFNPTFILGVPRVFEKVFNNASQKAAADGKGKIFNRAADVAMEYSRALDGKGPGLGLRVQHAIFDKLVYGKLRTALGGKCDYAISGGAPLGDRLGHFYRGIGLTVLEGYGLTESTAAITVNLPDALRMGTVGRPLGGTSVKVADDGELLFKGGQVFSGYWKNDEATAGAIEDGWLHTGDLGEVDSEGFVKITGRKKEILVTAGGKNVAPAVLEDRLRAHLIIDQCIVVGDGRPFIGALITLDSETLPGWAERNGKSGLSANDLLNDPDVYAEIQAAVDDANKAVSRAESIRKFTILPEVWSEEGGQLTPSMKLKRNVVTREHSDDIEALYTR